MDKKPESQTPPLTSGKNMRYRTAYAPFPLQKSTTLMGEATATIILSSRPYTLQLRGHESYTSYCTGGKVSEASELIKLNWTFLEKELVT